MAKRQRRDPEPGEFEDPLSNYDAKEFADPLDQSLAEDCVTTLPVEDYLKLNQSATVDEALRAMAEANDACVVVVNDEDQPVGVFSERDVLVRVAHRHAEVKDKPLSELMTRDPVVVHTDETPARVLNVMVTGGFRHVPLLDESDKVVGMIGARRMTAYLEKFFPEADAH